nr:hypothetical protein [Tanacetum cinerariifolium]
MDDPDITIEEYIRIEEEKVHRCGKVYNWETATYGMIWDNKDVLDLGSIETEFPAIVFNDTLTSDATLSYEPMVSSLTNDETDLRILFVESDDEDCTLVVKVVLLCSTKRTMYHGRLVFFGSNIRIQETKAKLFNEWERFTSNEGESIESYYHRFLKLMNDLKRNKHFPEKIASNLKFLNNLQPEWSRHVTIVHQTKDLLTTDYTQLYDFLKYNHKEVDELKAERLAKTQDPLALMGNSNNPYGFPAPHQDQLSFNQNNLQQPMPNPEDITDLTTAMNMALTLMAKAFKLNYSTPTNNNQRISSNPRNRQIAQLGMNMGQDRQMQMVRGYSGNQFRQYAGQNAGNLAGLVAARAEGNATGQNGNQIRCYNCRGVGQYARNCTIRPRRRDAAFLQTQLLIAQKEEAGIQLQAEEYDLMAVAADLDEIEEVNANCILMANLQQASTSGTQTDSAPVYDTDGSTGVHENCDDNEIFNMFTQEERYTELLEPIPESHQVPQHDNDVISEDTSVEQGGETVEQHPVNFEETCALYESLYQNLAIEVEKVNSVNHKLKETNADLTIELARYKNQERCFEISQEKYDKLERCYQQSVYQEQCLSKKINALHFSSARVQNFEIQFLKEASKFVGDFKSLANEVDSSLAKHKALELEIERLLKAVISQDIMIIVQNESVVDTSDLQTELEQNLPKIGKTNTLSNPVTSNSVSTPQESKGVNNDKVIAQGMFRITPDKTFREAKKVPNTVSASNRTKPITVSQPPIFTRKDVNSNLNGLCSTGIDNTKTRRPQPRSNTKNDRLPLCLRKQMAKVSIKEIQMKYQPKVAKLKKVGTLERLATPKPRKPRFLLRWSPTGRLFDQEGKLAASSNFESQYDCSNGDNACTSNAMEPKKSNGNLKLLINFVWKFMGTVRFENDHIAAILGFGDRSTNLYTINLHEMASASPICLMARASFTKSWLWHQRLSHLKFDTINDLARNDLVAGLPKFKCHKEHLCPSCEQGKSKRASHPPKPVPNSRKPDISFLYVFGALCYPKNDREDIGKLGAKCDIGFFIGYSADSCAYRVYNRRTKKIIETMNVSFNELSAMAFEQHSLKPRLNSMTSGQIISGLDLTYAPSTITT